MLKNERVSILFSTYVHKYMVFLYGKSFPKCRYVYSFIVTGFNSVYQKIDHPLLTLPESFTLLKLFDFLGGDHKTEVTVSLYVFVDDVRSKSLSPMILFVFFRWESFQIE